MGIKPFLSKKVAPAGAPRAKGTTPEGSMITGPPQDVQALYSSSTYETLPCSGRPHPWATRSPVRPG